MPHHSKWQDLPTEAINPGTLGIDRMPVPDIIDLVTAGDHHVVEAVQKERDRIAVGVGLLVDALKKGGRLFLVGAGTSGRLCIVEAAEIPTTFGTSPSLVRAIMAGGREAVFRSREGAEDNFEEGARSVSRLRAAKRDVVIGVSASGMTQFVRGALTSARNRGARTIFITCWPGTELQTFVDLMIAPEVGPEVIAGSTRLKAGTATKIVLNMLTTITMVRMGKTYGNLMVDVKTGSDKLRDRARRIVALVTATSPDEAHALLERSRWNVKAAIVMGKTGLSRAAAVKRLREADGFVREAIGEELEPVFRRLIGADAPGRR